MLYEVITRAVTEGFNVAGGISVSLTTAVAEMKGATRAYIGRYTDLTAGTVNLTASESVAEANATVTSTSFGGIASLSSLEATATASRDTETFVGRNSVIDLGTASLTGTATTNTGAPMATALINAASGAIGVSARNNFV